MRAAAAFLPEACSPTTSTGTSFCESSRMTASTVRMPALTLPSHTRAPPFTAVPLAARNSVLSRFILLSSRFRGQDGGRPDTQVYSTLIANQVENGTIDYNNIYHIFNDLRGVYPVPAWPTHYHSADKWEKVCPHH